MWKIGSNNEKIKCHSHSDNSHIHSIVLDHGISFYDSETWEVLSNFTTPFATARFISIVGDSNIFAIVPTSAEEVQIWDRNVKSVYFSFRAEEKITGIMLRPDILFIITVNGIHGYNLFDRNLNVSMPTCNNPYGAFDMPVSFSSDIIATLTCKIGHVGYYNYTDPSRPTVDIEAYDSDIRILRFSQNGELIAVTAVTHFSIKLFRVPNGKPLGQLRCKPIGDPKIVDIKFDSNSTQLAAISSSWDVYLFCLPVWWKGREKDPNQGPIRPVATFHPPNHTPFTFFFNEILYRMTILTNIGEIFIIKYNKKTNTLNQQGPVALTM